VALFHEATAAELAHGLTWYTDANRWCAQVARRHGLSTRQVCGIVAALSPRTEWGLNKRRAVQLITTGDTHGFTDGRRKAQRILEGEHPDDVLGGPKVRAFYDCLARPLESDSVVIDRHAFDATVGAVTNDDIRRRILDRKGGYDAVASLYRHAADTLGLRPHVVQAIVWSVWRNRYGYFAGSQFTRPGTPEPGELGPLDPSTTF